MKRKQNKIIDCLMNDAMKRNILGCTKTAIKAVTCVKYVKYIMGNQMQKLVEIGAWSHVEVRFKDNTGKKTET